MADPRVQCPDPTRHASFYTNQWEKVAPPTGPLDPGHLHTRVIKVSDKGGFFFLMPASLFVLEELPVLSSGARGGPSSLTFVDDDKVCTADKAHIHLAGTRSGQRPAPGRLEREVPFFFPLGLGGCVL